MAEKNPFNFDQEHDKWEAWRRGYYAAVDASAKHIVKLRWERGTFPDRSQWTREEAWAAIALALETASADLETLKSS
jgi:hypothetical protein